MHKSQLMGSLLMLRRIVFGVTWLTVWLVLMQWVVVEVLVDQGHQCKP